MKFNATTEARVLPRCATADLVEPVNSDAQGERSSVLPQIGSPNPRKPLYIGVIMALAGAAISVRAFKRP